MNTILNKLKGGLIVSCQALDDEPLHSSYIMSRMAVAAMMGGASGIRSNSVEDIIEIKKTVDLPVIGIIKKEYPDSNVYITPTIKEIDALLVSGCEIIALDATQRLRPGGISLDDFFRDVRKKYPDILFMADCSTYDEAIHASQIGFNIVASTLHGYTEYTKGVSLPNIDLLSQMVNNCNCPVIAEGGIWLPEQLEKIMSLGVLAAVVGTAITRPAEITKRFVQVLPSHKNL